jgi:methyltransferase (TIGR00027 family)
MQAGKPSETARRVAAQRLTFPRLAGPGDAAADEALHRDVAAGVAWQPSPMTRYLAARTAFFDAAVVGWTGPQAVCLGAGYDGRSLRYSGPRWWEVDHPSTQADKAARLARLGIRAAATLVAADFTTGTWWLPGHDPALPTLFLCEGVLSYLPEPTRLLVQAASVAGAGSVLAAEVPVRPVAPSATRVSVRQHVARAGEPMTEPWERADLAARLAACGWQLRSARDARGRAIEDSELSAALVTATRSAPDALGEPVALAEEDA